MPEYVSPAIATHGSTTDNGPADVSNPERFTISGHVSDAQTGETLISAGVLSDADLHIGTVTNNFGYYSLTVPAGTVLKDGNLS